MSKPKNALGWIYAIQDSGYERGIKVGMCGSTNGLACWEAVPCYSPRSMHYKAGWCISLSFVLGNGERCEALRDVERHVHDRLHSHWLDHGCNGKEWFDLTAADAIVAVSDILRQEPAGRDRNQGRLVRNDQFRNPHPRHFEAHNRKIVAWIYREQFTGRIKTQVIDDWRTPREKRRRYSRNGFDALAAFSYGGLVSGKGNAAVHDAWLQVMKKFALSAEDTVYGWLNEGVRPDDVMTLYRSRALDDLDITSDVAPESVKKAYNRAE